MKELFEIITLNKAFYALYQSGVVPSSIKFPDAKLEFMLKVLSRKLA